MTISPLAQLVQQSEEAAPQVAKASTPLVPSLPEMRRGSATQAETEELIRAAQLQTQARIAAVRS